MSMRLTVPQEDLRDRVAGRCVRKPRRAKGFVPCHSENDQIRKDDRGTDSNDHCSNEWVRVVGPLSYREWSRTTEGKIITPRHSKDRRNSQLVKLRLDPSDRSHAERLISVVLHDGET